MPIVNLVNVWMDTSSREIEDDGNVSDNKRQRRLRVHGTEPAMSQNDTGGRRAQVKRITLCDKILA